MPHCRHHGNRQCGEVSFCHLCKSLGCEGEKMGGVPLGSKEKERVEGLHVRGAELLLGPGVVGESPSCPLNQGPAPYSSHNCSVSSKSSERSYIFNIY